MALFDFLKLSDDPNQNAALTQGLLSAAFGGLAARGTPLQAIGQAGLSGLGGYSGALDRQEQTRRAGLMEKRQSLQDELVKNQLDEQKRQAALRALPAQFAIPGAKPETMDNRDVGQPGEAPIPSGGFDMPGYIQALMGQDPVQALQLQAATQKQTKPEYKVVGNSLVKIDGGGVSEAYSPDAKDTEIIRNLKTIYGDGTPEFKAAAQRLGVKLTTHTPSTTVNINPEKSFAQAIGPIAAKKIEESSSAAEGAQASNATIASIRDAMKAGGVILGPGATVRQTGLRVGQLLGAGSAGSADSLATTKAVEQGLAQIELDAAKLMKGQGAITESERGIMKRAAAGEIGSLTAKELDVALKAIERNNNRAITSHQSRMKQLPAEATGPLAPLLDSAPTTKVRRFNPATGMIE